MNQRGEEIRAKAQMWCEAERGSIAKRVWPNTLIGEGIPYLLDRVAALEAEREEDQSEIGRLVDKIREHLNEIDQLRAERDAAQRRAEAAEAEVRRNAVLMAVHGFGGYELSAQWASDGSGSDADISLGVNCNGK